MLAERLDQWLPWLAFFYGTFMLVAEGFLHHRIGRMSTQAQLAYAEMKKHMALSWVCFFVGALWVIQNIWGPVSPFSN